MGYGHNVLTMESISENIKSIFYRELHVYGLSSQRCDIDT
jgi:hypothetical protein